MKNIQFIRDREQHNYHGIRIMADSILHKQIANIVTTSVPKGSTILDFGAGEGALSQRLSDLGYHVISTDLRFEYFRAGNEFININLNDDVSTECFINKYKDYFDLAIGIEVIEHLENPWKYIRNLISVVKPGGYLIVSTPNISSWFSRLYFLFKGRFPQFTDDSRAYGHINPINYDEIVLILMANGMEDVQISPGGILPILWLNNGIKSFLLSVLGFITRPFMLGHKYGWCNIFVSKRLMR